MNDKLLVLGTMAYDAIESPFGKTGKILGDTGSWYKTENKKKYEANWDTIWGKKESPETKTKAV